jgi:hypothetical protein
MGGSSVIIETAFQREQELLRIALRIALTKLEGPIFMRADQLVVFPIYERQYKPN